MNGGTIFFQDYLAYNVFRNTTVRIGGKKTLLALNTFIWIRSWIVEPDPPEHVDFTFPSNTVCQYDWVPPNGNVIGRIKGYNLSYEGDCGICLPIGMVNSSTFTAQCSGWIANGQTCYFEVRTVTEEIVDFTVTQQMWPVFLTVSWYIVQYIRACSLIFFRYLSKWCWSSCRLLPGYGQPSDTLHLECKIPGTLCNSY